MENKSEIISRDLQSQWQDHFHMRDQTWKSLNYSILLFIGVVGLQMKVTDKPILSLAFLAVLLTSAFGILIAIHHRRRQHEKFEIIKIYERELGLDQLLAPVLGKSRKTWDGRINTAVFVVVMQAVLCVVSALMLGKLLITQ